MREIHFDSLRIMVVEHIKEINATDPKAQSTEWYFLKYLKRIVDKTDPPSRSGQVEGTIRSLVRFYCDNIDEKSELADRCIRIYIEYRRVLREHQTKV